MTSWGRASEAAEPLSLLLPFEAAAAADFFLPAAAPASLDDPSDRSAPERTSSRTWRSRSG